MTPLVSEVLFLFPSSLVKLPYLFPCCKSGMKNSTKTLTVLFLPCTDFNDVLNVKLIYQSARVDEMPFIETKNITLFLYFTTD